MKRRDFLAVAAGGAALGAWQADAAGQPAARERCKAVVFDAFPIFDPRPVFSLAAKLVPEKGEELVALWRTRQFEYTWLTTAMGRYVDFPTITRDALVFAAGSLKLDLSPAAQDSLLDGYYQLKAWPDVLPALQELKKEGLKLGFLSNFSREMLAANIKSAGLEGFFEKILSTDGVKAFKPAPQAYQMGVDAFALRPQEMVFAAFAGWDAAGAKAFGYPTFWVNRQNAVAEELPARPDATGSLKDLVAFAIK